MKSLYRHAFTLLFCIITIIPVVAFGAEGIKTFQTIPFLDGKQDMQTYVEALYKLSIALAACIVVIKIIIAGATLTATDKVSARENAKKDIGTALLGLLIILAAVTILETVDPNLKNLNALRNASYIMVNPNESDVESSASAQSSDESSDTDEGTICYSETGCSSE